MESPKVTIHYSSPKFYLVPRAGLQSQHTAAGGSHPFIAAEGGVIRLVQPASIKVEECTVSLRVGDSGPHAVAHLPCSRHRHSEDA